MLWPSDDEGSVGGLRGLGINLGGLGFGWESAETATGDASRYTLASSTALSEGLYFGAAYHWSSDLDRQNSWDLGLIARPAPWFSLGAQVSDVGGVYVDGVIVDPTWHLGAALRPFGPNLTLSADATLWNRGSVSYGDEPEVTFLADWQVLPGVLVRGGYATDSETVFAGLTLRSNAAEFGSFLGTRSDPAPGAAETGGASWARISSRRHISVFDGWTPKQIVRIKLEGRLSEEPDGFAFFTGYRNRSLYGLLHRIRQIQGDEAVGGVLLELDSFKAGRSDLEELYEALLDLREHGVKVAVYSNEYGMGTTYLAAAADRIYLYPAGMVLTPGQYLKGFYARELLDTLALKPEFLTVGEYKSAAEPLTNSEMSDAAREELRQIAETWNHVWVEAVAMGRAVSEETAQSWIDRAVMTASEAKEAGVVDALIYPDQLKKTVRDDLELNRAQFLPEVVYSVTAPEDNVWEDMTSPKIAVIFAEGMIDLGESRRSFLSASKTIGSETLSEAIRSARNNRRVEAIVLRVDSPGGFALASDIITREVERTVDASIEDTRHVPVIVSMSDVAASGGYHISALADKIVANRSTITGSIGVIFGRVNYSGLLDSIGVNIDGVMLGENAGIVGPEPWTDEHRMLIRKSMDRVYDDFVGIVSRGRNMSHQEVDDVGRGRVWSGEDAIKVGLVDQQGGFLDAIELARSEAGLSDDAGLVFYPQTFSLMAGLQSEGADSRALPTPLAEFLRVFEKGLLSDGRVMMLAPLDRDDTVQK
jgi:protease-4